MDRRLWPLLVTIAFLVLGLAFTFWWGSVVQHQPHLWLVPADLQSSYVSATQLAFGHLGSIWEPGGQHGAGAQNTFPGLVFVLAPLGALATTFRTTLLVGIPHGGALAQRRMVGQLHNGLVSNDAVSWTSHGYHYVLQPQWTQFVVPLTLLLSCLALYSCDALAERLGVTRRRRILLVFVEAVLLWNVSVSWGHPEDAIALALAIYAFVLALDGRLVGAGWLIGSAVCFQPFVLLILPVLLVMAGWPAAFGMAVRSAVPPLVLVAGPLIAGFHATFQALAKQPTFPNIDHRTPWTALAAHISGRGRSYTVAGGPGHLVSVILACGLGAWVRRWRTRPELLAWSCALGLALWPYTETVMTPYYVWPALALGVVVAAKASTPRFVVAIGFAILTSVVAQWHLAWLPWWLLVLGGLTIVLVAAASPAPVGAEILIETGRLRVWLNELLEPQPRALTKASSRSNSSTVSQRRNTEPQAQMPASSTSNLSRSRMSAARKKR
jgi:hypothetical protein